MESPKAPIAPDRIWVGLGESSGCHSAARQRLKPFPIPSPFDPDVRGGTFDVTEIFVPKFNVTKLFCIRSRLTAAHKSSGRFAIKVTIDRSKEPRRYTPPRCRTLHTTHAH